MQGHTRGGQCDWRNVTGGRLVRADGVRLGPARQAQLTSLMESEGRATRAGLTAGPELAAPLPSLACGCLGPSVWSPGS